LWDVDPTLRRARIAVTLLGSSQLNPIRKNLDMSGESLWWLDVTGTLVIPCAHSPDGLHARASTLAPPDL
jgi:hypothetical protein